MSSVTVTIPLSERDFQRQIIEYAQLRGWRVAHFRPAETKKGWRTPVEADGAGFPDLVMVRGERLVVAEIKSEKGRLSDDQQAWLGGFGQAIGGESVFVWRPSDWPIIQSELDCRS